MKVLITTSTFAEFNNEPLCVLNEKGVEYLINPFGRKLEKSELIDLLKRDSFLGVIAGTEKYDSDVFDAQESLKIISRVGVGMDAIDIDAAQSRSISVVNTPSVLTDAVSELTIGLILDLLRNISFNDRLMRSGVWKKKMGELLKGKTLGIVGFGKMGRRVAEIAYVFGAYIIFYDVAQMQTSNFKQVELEVLLKDSDIISFHCSTKEKIIGEKEINILKDGVYIVNTARGGIIDEEALCKALQSGKVRGAALDVFGKEPYDGPLCSMENVVCTSHVGSYARAARIEMEKQAVNNFINECKKIGAL